MAEIAVSILTDQISALLSQGGALLEELKPDVRFIKEELGSMKAFLREAEAKEEDTALELKEWVKQVREVSFDIEDILDDFLFHFARNHGDGFCGRMQQIYSSIKNLRTRRQISSEIKSIKSRIENISARHRRYEFIYGIPARASSSAIARNTGYDTRATSPLIEEAKLVGIDKPKGELMSQILDDNPRLKVVSVVGMGGLGKTTLVRKVYDDAAVKKQFQSHAWLTISQTFHVTVSLKDLIQRLFDEIKEPVPIVVMECTDVVRLSEIVKDFLQDRRYILVLDDVWSTNSWDAFRDLLPDCNLGCRVMLTTRINDVAIASRLESHDHVHRMEPLSEKESWTLFCNRMFYSSHCPPLLEDVSRSILKKCEGLPLAIVAICGILALKDKRKEEWASILQRLGGELEGSGKLEKIKKILLLSYNDLPHYLKSCLLYLCIYPEDYEINLDILIEKWIAQGFVKEIDEISAFDIGRRYAKELVSRSLIQVAITSTYGNLESIRVHDFLREIIAHKSSEQNFATGYYWRRSQKVRLLAIHDFAENPESEELNDCLKSLRSLEFFGNRSLISTPVLSKFLQGCSKKLKVLKLNGAPMEEIPNEVLKLFYLKFLCLQDTEVRTIPKSIGKLQNLEFLNISYTNVTKLPVEILKLRKLRQISVGKTGDYSENFPHQGIKFPDGIGKLLSLEYLGHIEADGKEIVREVGKLTKLRILLITEVKRDDGKEVLSSLAKLTNLRKLSVSSINGNEMLDLQHSISLTLPFLEEAALAGQLGSVPQWVVSLQSLTALILKNSELKEDDVVGGGLQALQVLPNLAVLHLYCAYEGETLSYELVQKLKSLDKRSEEYQKIANIPQVGIAYWMDGGWHESFLP